jgi:hypothetical protein
MLIKKRLTSHHLQCIIVTSRQTDQQGDQIMQDKDLTVQELIDILMDADLNSIVMVEKYSCGSTFKEPLLDSEMVVSNDGRVTILMDYN